MPEKEVHLLITKRTCLLVAIALLVFNFGFTQDVTSRVDRIYQATKDEPGYSIAVFKGDEIILERQYGSANLDYNIPISNETVFDIGSIAKQFTAAAILLLEEDGKLSLEHPAYQYIEELPRYAKGDPTIEQLLNQTSGIMEVDPYFYLTGLSWYDLLTQSRLVNIIVNMETLNFVPGTYFQYTNANYILLAEIVEKVSGQSFEEYLQAHIFDPLNMENTIKKSSTYPIIKNRAIGYVEDEGMYYKTHLHGAIYHGDGQMATTPRDMFKWHLGIKNAVIGTPELWQKMHTKGFLNDGAQTDYGLGVEFETHNGYEAMGFDGMITGGFVSKYLYFPELDIAFFTTQNTFDEDFYDQFFQLVDLYVPEKAQANEIAEGQEGLVKLSKEELKQYEGDYLFIGNEEEDIRSNRLQLKGEELLLLTLDGDEIGALEPSGDSRFMFNGNLVEFNIQNDEKEYRFYANQFEKPWLFQSFQAYEYTGTELKEFEGLYMNRGLQVVNEIKLEEGALYLYFRNGGRKTEIEPLSKDLFSIPNYPIQFLRDKNGKVTALKILELSLDKI